MCKVQRIPRLKMVDNSNNNTTIAKTLTLHAITVWCPTAMLQVRQIFPIVVYKGLTNHCRKATAAANVLTAQRQED